MGSCACGVVSGTGYTACLSAEMAGNLAAGTCETAQALGATDQQLADLACGCVEPEILLPSLSSVPSGLPTPTSSTTDILAGNAYNAPIVGPFSLSNIQSTGSSVSATVSSTASSLGSTLSNLWTNFSNAVGTVGIWILVAAAIALTLFLIFEFTR